jgi:hypothetical protein
MATWKKVIVSGSAAHLSSVTASNLTNDNILISGVGGRIESSGLTYNGSILNLGSAIVSASIFSGSFRGNGSMLTGITATSLDIDNFGSDLTGVTIANTDKFLMSDGGLDGRINASQIPPYVFSKVGGDILITSAGSASIQPDSVTLGVDTTGSYVASLGTVTGLTVGSNTGEGSKPTLSVNYGSTSNTAVQGNTSLTINGTPSEIEVSGGSITLGSGGTVTVGLPNDVAITGKLTVGGDLVVNGDVTNVNTTNLNVEDAYILLNSGSAGTTDSGIIFGGSNGVAQAGAAVIWDASYNTNDGRLAVVGNLASNAIGSQTPSYYVAGVFEGTEANAATAEADHPGNIRIDNGDIFIYV